MMLARFALVCCVGHAGNALATVPLHAGNDDATGREPRVATFPARADTALVRFVPSDFPATLTRTLDNPRRGTPDAKGASPERSRKTPPAGPAPAGPAPARSSSPVVVASGTGPGQHGYVHYFIIEAPDGSTETQVGMELPDGRIAWSFPELGVVVSPFIESGEMDVYGKIYAVRHLYGIRPFPDDDAMRLLQKDLVNRVIPWIEDGTPYCNPTVQPKYLCTSCLGFVLRILFPGRSPAYPALPPDFRSAGADPYYSTGDLLVYLTGLHGFSTPEARLKRIEGLALPQNLREELVQLANSMESGDRTGSADTVKPQNVSGKGRPRAGSVSKSGQPRPAQGKKL